MNSDINFDLPEPFPSDPKPTVKDAQNFKPVLAGSQHVNDVTVPLVTAKIQEQRMPYPFLQGMKDFFPSRVGAIGRAVNEGLPSAGDLMEGANTAKFIISNDLDAVLDTAVDDGRLRRENADNLSKEAHGMVSDFYLRSKGSGTVMLANTFVLNAALKGAPWQAKAAVLGANFAVGMLGAAYPVADLGKVMTFGRGNNAPAPPARKGPSVSSPH